MRQLIQNPVLTGFHPDREQDTPLKKSSHGNFVKTEQGRVVYDPSLRSVSEEPGCVCPGKGNGFTEAGLDGGRMAQGSCVPLTEVDGPAESESSQRSDFPSPRRYHTDFRSGTDLAREEWLFLEHPLKQR